MRTLLDTHAWLWWVSEDRQLSTKARAAIKKSQDEHGLSLSFISIWEVAKKIEKGQLALDRPLDEWLDAATTVPGLRIVELTRPILVESCRLPQPFIGDPADQILVATARHDGSTLITKDRRIRAYEHVRSLW